MAGGGGGPPIPARKKKSHDEDGVQAREPQAIDDEIDFTPMVDIVFLLLIFFILTTNISNARRVVLPRAFHGENIVEKDCVVVYVQNLSGEVPTVTREDGSPFSAEVEQQEAELVEYVEEALGSRKTNVMIKSEGNVRYGEIERLRQAISQACEEGQQIYLGVHQ